MMRPRRGGAFTVLSAALLTALLTMPAGAAVNDPDREATPATPLVRKVCLDGIERYEFKVWKGGVGTPNGTGLSWLRISPANEEDKFQYESAVWQRDGNEYFNTYDATATRAQISNASAVCSRAPNIVTTAAVASSTAWQQVVKATSYAAQTAAWNTWHSTHCVEGGTVDCGATYPTMAETCALNPPLTLLSTGDRCPG